MSDYNIPVSGGVNGLNVPLHGHIAVYNKEFPVIPNPEGEVTGYVTKLGFTPEILQVKDPEVHDWARAEEKPTYTKAEVGLGNVDNTSDLNKPISTATQTALDGKVDKVPGKALSTNDYTDTDKAIVDGVTSALATKVDKIAGKGLSTNDYTDYEKTKLAYIQSGAEVNVQVDWFESNRWSDAFILNKPTKLSDFSNDTGFITSTVDNLTYYYKKSETYTQAEVNALIGSIVTISFLVVQTLPQTGEANIIYLVPAEDPNPDNIYEEYIYVNNNWEMIGTTKVDLSNYYTKTETDTLLNGKVDKDGDKVLSDNNYSDTDKTKLDGIEAEANKTIVDTEISATSTNPLQNKAIYDLLNDLLPEAEETGNPISISNASGFNAKALTVDMLPIQAGSGTPSPDNVRPISGRNSLDITVNGNTETINFGETVYGGTCDVVNGGTSDKWTFETFDGSSNEEWSLQSINTHNIANFRIFLNTNVKRYQYTSISNRLTVQTSLIADTTTEGYTISNENILYIRIESSKASTVEQFRTWLSSNNVEICGEKVTPTTLTTPAKTISLNKGNNTLSTSGDNMDLKYSTIISNATPSLSMGNPLAISRPTEVVEEPTEETDER